MKEEILEAIEDKEIILSDMENAYAIIDALDYDGRLHEIIDSYICIYYYELRSWAVDNWEFVEEAIQEGLCEGVSDYHKLIQAGQYVSLRQDALDAVESIYNDFNNTNRGNHNEN